MGCHSKRPLDSELGHVGSTRRDVLPTRANRVTKRLAYDPDPFFRGIIWPEPSSGQKVEAIVEAFTTMENDLENEQRAFATMS